MKRIIIYAALLLTSAGAFAQQRPHYTQYILNPYIINPGLTGIDNYVDLKISTRDQWVGLNGAPKTSYLTIQGPIGKSDYRTSATSYAVPGENPRGKQYWENYTAAAPHQGIGMMMINDRTGSFNRFTIDATYAYHVGLNATTNLALGFSAGVTNVSVDRSKQDFTGGGDPYDPALASSISKELNRWRPDMGVGLWLYGKNYFVGLSAQQVIPQKLAFADDAAIIQKGRLIPHSFLMAGYRFQAGENFNIIPSVMLKYIKGSSQHDVQPEFNTKIQYQDRFWLGGSYRYQNGYAAMAGLSLSNLFNASYSYDFTTTALNTVSRGTHEIIIGFLIGNKYSGKCPRCY